MRRKSAASSLGKHHSLWSEWPCYVKFTCKRVLCSTSRVEQNRLFNSGDVCRHSKARGLHSMALCFGLFHSIPEMISPKLFKPPPLLPRQAGPRVLCNTSSFTFAFTLRGAQLVLKAQDPVVIPSCVSAFFAIAHLLRIQSMTLRGPTAGASFFRLWVCLMDCDGSSEATGPRGKVGSNVP